MTRKATRSNSPRSSNWCRGKPRSAPGRTSSARSTSGARPGCGADSFQGLFEAGPLRAEIQPHEARRAELRSRGHRDAMLEEVLVRIGYAEAGGVDPRKVARFDMRHLQPRHCRNFPLYQVAVPPQVIQLRLQPVAALAIGGERGLVAENRRIVHRGVMIRRKCAPELRVFDHGQIAS